MTDVSVTKCWYVVFLFLSSFNLRTVEIASSVKLLGMCQWYVCSCVCTDLEMYVLNTKADMQDLTFPHSYNSNSILQIPAHIKNI